MHLGDSAVALDLGGGSTQISFLPVHGSTLQVHEVKGMGLLTVKIIYKNNSFKYTMHIAHIVFL